MSNENDEQIMIVNEAILPRFYAQIPFILDDLGLSTQEYRLYARIVRRVGNNGACWESVRNLAKGCKMGNSSVTRARIELANPRDELGGKSLIRVEEVDNPNGGKKFLRITITNIWAENNMRYDKSLPRDLSNPYLETSQIPTQGLKKQPLKNSQNGTKTKKASHSSPRVTPPAEKASAGDGINTISGNSNDDSSINANDNHSNTNTAKKHAAIKAVKEGSGYYPPKALYGPIINLLGENPDIEKMRRVFTLWTAKGHKPTNYNGWLFDWYPNDAYYVPSAEKMVLDYVVSGGDE